MLNVWSTHQFWLGLFQALGVPANRIAFSSNTSEEQGREFGRGRGTVDCCYPVKCISGHYGELLARDKHRKIDVRISPMIYSLPSFLRGQVLDNLACPRVMAAPENIKAGFLKEKDAFADRGIRYVTPLVSLGDPPLVPKQLHPALKEIFPEIEFAETKEAVRQGYEALKAFNEKAWHRGREVLERCAAWLGPDGESPLDDAARAHLQRLNEEMAADGLRVIALAEGAASAEKELPPRLMFLGFAAMADPPAPGVPEAITALREAGVRTVMVTGDQRATGEAIARQLGMLGPGDEGIDARALGHMPDDVLDRRLPLPGTEHRDCPPRADQHRVALRDAGRRLPGGDGDRERHARRVS